MNLREEDSFKNLAIFWQNEIFLKNFNFWYHIRGKGVKIRLFYAWSFFHQLHRFGDRKKKIPLPGPIPAVFLHKSAAHMREWWFLAKKNEWLLLPVFEVQPLKFENLMSDLQLSADQLMLWSVTNFFGHLSGQLEILQAKISWKMAVSSAK